MDAFFDSWPLWAQAALIVFLLALSGFFSMAETSMVASNRHRLRAMANSGHAGAAITQKLLKRVDTLLSVLLIANNLINTILPILVTGIALHLFGTNGLVLSIATLTVAFLIIIFSEITPKVIGASFAEKISPNYYSQAPVVAGELLCFWINGSYGAESKGSKLTDHER
jgi:Mg2+/Co2+ transporter CorB